MTDSYRFFYHGAQGPGFPAELWIWKNYGYNVPYGFSEILIERARQIIKENRKPTLSDIGYSSLYKTPSGEYQIITESGALRPVSGNIQILIDYGIVPVDGQPTSNKSGGAIDASAILGNLQGAKLNFHGEEWGKGALSEGELNNLLQIGVQTDLGDASLISQSDVLKQKAAEALNNFVSSVKNTLDWNIRLTSVWRKETGEVEYGKTERVVTGYYPNGTKRYKTVVTKFAILDIYDVKRGVRGTKIDSILIGKIDTLAYRPTQGELDGIEGMI